MFTVINYDFRDNYWKVRGLSTDSKPTSGVPNGSEFLEIDTGTLFYFDAENTQWIDPTAQS